MRKVAAYIRVSTGDQASNGHGLDAQRGRIEEEAQHRAWDVTWFVDEAVSGAQADRPALSEALHGLAGGGYEALVAAKLDRLTRSVVDLGSILEASEREGWSLVLLDFDIDTSKPTGRLVAHVLGAVAQFERERIGERTKEALAQARRRGVRLGRPPAIPDDVVDRIRKERESGNTLAMIADGLNRDGVATAQGGRKWWGSTVRAVLERA